MAAASPSIPSTTPSNTSTTSSGGLARGQPAGRVRCPRQGFEIGGRLLDLTGVSGRRSSAPPPHNLLPGSGGEQLLVQGGEATSDFRPAVAAALCLRASATRPAFRLAAGGVDECLDERVLVVGPNEPARRS